MVKGLCRAKHAVVADHATLDCQTVFHLNYTGKYAFVREVHLVNLLATLGEYATVLQLNQPKMRPKIFEIDSASSCENTIL
jgi:hypothetical protein